MHIQTSNLYRALCGIADAAAAPLFTAYQDDLHRHDRDTLEGDAQPGDTWLWALKECGTWLVLIEAERSMLDAVLSTESQSQRYFLLHVGPDGKGGSIREIKRTELEREIDRVTINPSRQPRRTYLYPLLKETFEGTFQGTLKDSVFLTELGVIGRTVNETAYIKVSGRTFDYVIPSTGAWRQLRLNEEPRVQGTFRLTITSPFGHATIRETSASAFTAARRRLAQVAA